MDKRSALIVGAGAGLSASLARLFAKDGMRIALAARDAGKLAALAEETDAACFTCDVSQPDDVARMFAQLDAVPDVVVFNPSARVRGAVTELDPAEVARVIAIIFTGASASVKGYPLSSSFAMGKFALRGLAQSMARELAPKGIHIGHVVIDGGIRSETRRDPNDAPDSLLDPDAIAESYLHLVKQHRSAWTWEIELRPWVEKF